MMHLLVSKNYQVRLLDFIIMMMYFTTSKRIFRGGRRPFVGAVCPAAPTQGSLQIMYLQGWFPGRPYKSICRGGWKHQPPLQINLQGRLVLPAAPTNLFIGAARITSRPYKSICRGGCSTSRPYKQVFVGAVQSRTAPIVCFPAKKIKFTIQNRVAERPTTNVSNRVRVAEHPATNIPNRVRVAECPASNVPNRVRVAERPATMTTSTRVFYKLQLQV